MAAVSEDVRLKKCQTAAFRFLKIRLRSVEELRQKLQQKNFDADIIAQTLDWLIEYEFLNDQVFAQQWIRYRLQRPYGPKRIRFELQTKGVNKDLIERELTRALHTFQEEKIVLELAKRRASKYEGLAPEKIKQRVHGFLARRGFDGALIYKAIQQL